MLSINAHGLMLSIKMLKKRSYGKELQMGLSKKANRHMGAYVRRVGGLATYYADTQKEGSVLGWKAENGTEDSTEAPGNGSI